MRIASLIALTLLWLLTIAGGWYVGREQGRSNASSATEQAPPRECRTLVLATGGPSRQQFEQLQNEGWQATANDPGPEGASLSGGQGPKTRLLTLCKP